MPVQYISFPQTETPLELYQDIIQAFNSHFAEISSEDLEQHLPSNSVLEVVGESLENIGFLVEGRQQNTIHRPVFFGENGQPTVRYQIDSYQPVWRCGLEVEAGRSWNGNAVHRDLIQGLVMTDVDILVIAVPKIYRPGNIRPFDKAKDLAQALYGHSRMKLPYKLLLIGY
jgi:hypothetical protein